MEFIRTGSSKDIYHSPQEGLLDFNYSDRVSVFDIGPVPISFPSLGYFRGVISNKLFSLINQAEYETAFCATGSTGKRTRMYPLNIPEAELSFPNAIGRLLPVEILFRFKITSKFFGRIQKGEVERSKVDMCLQGNTLEIGTRLHPPFIECSTKQQAADAYIDNDMAAQLCGVSLCELLDFYANDVTPIANFLHTVFKSAGFELADGKFEGGIGRDRHFILADSISPDELRLVGNDGKSYDKDPVRKWYMDNYPDWVRELNSAKEKYPNDKDKWPSYPASPTPEVVRETVARYRVVAMAIGAIED